MTKKIIYSKKDVQKIIADWCGVPEDDVFIDTFQEYIGYGLLEYRKPNFRVEVTFEEREP